MSIQSHRLRIEAALRQFIETMGEKNTLRDACEYALTNGGKRLRPILVLMIAEALGKGKDVLPAALSVEFFHTTSLIADDLPCMDDDDIRRNRPSVHKQFGESVAILASYALIAEGYGGIHRNCHDQKADGKIALLCLEIATRCAGIQGATNGQFLDLNPPASNLETIEKIIYQKTGTLFEISFVFGWLFGGGDPARLPEVCKCACHLGMAFQIADDLLDNQQDLQQQSAVNLATVFGEPFAHRYFEKEMEQFINGLDELGLKTASFQEVIDWLNKYSAKK